MLHIAICDDHEFHRDYISNQVQKLIVDRAYECQHFSCGQELIDFAQKSPDLLDMVFLDIQMPGIDGIDTADLLSKITPSCLIIFISAYQQYMTDVYKVPHFYYILKASLEKKLPQAVNQALLHCDKKPQTSLRISFGHEVFFIPQSEIIYLERSLRTTQIITHSGCFITREKIEALLLRLPESCWLRCHVSYAVNTQYINKFASDIIFMRNGVEIPVSRAYQQQTKYFIKQI